LISISKYLQNLKERQECALIPFITAGDPDLETTAKALKVLDDNGADIIELGVPYSDPLADGPIIQAAATRALQKEIRLEQILELVTKINPSLKAPIVLFTYYNPILNRGIESFLPQIARAGIKGLVIPDLPVEEASDLLELALVHGIEIILLVAPNSSAERIKSIAYQSQGFIYLVSVTGVTGMRSQVEERARDLLLNIHSITDKPIGIGFGISNSEQARQMKDWGADAVIVGSAFVERLAKDDDGLQAVKILCQELKLAIAL
jgi:tryptophan synthase alpha chain